MIQYKTGSIFESDAKCLIVPVNCVGVMGKGLALEFKRRFPFMFDTYHAMCAEGNLRVGTVMFYKLSQKAEDMLCLFPTKDHWREKSSPKILAKSFEAFLKYSPVWRIDSVAFPEVGCGLGGLDFQRQVQPMFEKYFATSSMNVEVYLNVQTSQRV